MSSTCSWTSRLTRPLFLWWYAALAAQLAVDWLLKYGNPHSPLVSLAAFLPALVWIMVIGEFIRAVHRLDEFQRHFQLQAIFIACALSVVLALILAACDRAGIYHASSSVLGAYFLLLLVAVYGFLAWRYR